jgi:hypothetical protein
MSGRSVGGVMGPGTPVLAVTTDIGRGGNTGTGSVDWPAIGGGIPAITVEPMLEPTLEPALEPTLEPA